MKRLTGFFDGASRGNPGMAGAGCCILDGGDVVWECAKYLGVKTNNEAEYAALIILLTEARSRGADEIEIRGDSKLVVSQVNRKWKINKPHLMVLAKEARGLMDGMKARLVWVSREENRLADKLSNRAIDERDDRRSG
ncbi:MAG: ribonuclease HI family protein [Synergistaceae bacterium]|nr:ribonuclease HI family protein [Synergistaceae bacterium]